MIYTKRLTRYYRRYVMHGIFFFFVLKSNKNDDVKTKACVYVK